MPAIPGEVLDTVVYLYPDEQSALAGERAGGSGCLVVIPVQQEPLVGFMYVVTNSHVIREGKASAIRVNTREGGMGIIHSTTDGWIHRPDGDDIAILSVNFEYDEVKAKGIPEEWFATKEKIERYKIGPGDEAFMVGRFVNHEGNKRISHRLDSVTCLCSRMSQSKRVADCCKKYFWWNADPFQDTAVLRYFFTHCHSALFVVKCHQ